MTRKQSICIFFLCLTLTPLLLVAFFWQSFMGNPERAIHIAKAYDIYGNNALGGTIGKTVSTQVGNALVAGKAWAKLPAKIIDALMGENHCLDCAGK